MLASNPNDRPTAHQITGTLFPDELPPMEWTRIGSTGLSPKIPRPTPRKGVVSRRHKQLDVTRTKPAKSKNKERKKSQNLGVSSQNERALLRDQNHFLTGMNNEVKVRRSTRSVVLGKVGVMSFEDIEEARAKRVAKEVIKSKRKPSQKRKSTALEEDEPEPEPEVARMIEAPELWRAPLARVI
jgi:hypothetical protein